MVRVTVHSPSQIALGTCRGYLRSRGLADPGSPDLLYHPDLTDYEARRGWSGIVAIVRDGAGAPTGGIHRTFLLDDGSDKAPPGKKMLDAVGGGSVRLAAVGDYGHLGIAEGIETALSAEAIFGVPTWAALSADGLRRWQWPAGISRVTIFADAGDAGAQAAAVLAERLSAAGVANAVVAPLHGDDFNDDLRHGATAADYQIAAPVVAATAPLASATEFERAARGLTNPPDLTVLGSLLGQLVMARLEPLPERQILAAIKSSTGIAVSILEKQIAELRRRLNATGDIHQRPIRPSWASQLRLDLAGTPERNEANVITALSNDEAFAGALVFDEFRQETMVNRALPWDEDAARLPRPWSDADDVRCAEWLQHREINVAPIVVSRSATAVARDIRVHPVRDYLNGLVWDGVPRLATWAITYLGAEDTALNRAFGSRWMISAVARIMRPGAKVDHMLILEGPQGAKKSTALRALAGDEWFTDELAEIGSKDAAQQMRGIWIIEIAELDAIGRAEVSRIKAFLTRTVDRYRPPYERYVIEVPRQCVFAGSVNPDTYLRDETGNRRFWPVRCGSINLDALRRDRDQLWAEAVVRFRDGAIWWLDEPELIADATAEQDARYQSDAWDPLIERWLVYERRRVNRGYGYDDWVEEETKRAAPITDVSVGEILEQAIRIEPGRWNKSDQMRVGAYLKANRWRKYQATRAETEKDIMETAIEARQRHYGVTTKQARDERLGTAFGRLAWRGMITTAQYEAGREFGELYRRHHMAIGLPLPTPRSIAGLLVSGGVSGGSSGEPDAAVVERLRRRFDAATDALDQCDRDHRFSPGRRPAMLIYRVICVDEDTTMWAAEDLGNLRVALNALMRVFRLCRQ